MQNRQGFTLVEMLIVVGIILLAMAIAMPLLGAFVQGSAVDRTADVLGSVLTAARSVAVSQHKFVAVYLDADRDVRLFRFPKDDNVPPVDVEDSTSTSSDDTRQDLWEPVRGVRSWRMFDNVVFANGTTPYAINQGMKPEVVLIAPNGMVLENVRVSPLGNKDPSTGQANLRRYSITCIRVYTTADYEEAKAKYGQGSPLNTWLLNNGRALYIDRITAQILNVPGGDDMIKDPVYADP
jgi:prepilin-type N-terminal cleavage/methylation domain-containing protein